MKSITINAKFTEKPVTVSLFSLNFRREKKNQMKGFEN